ncbi:hypothetical protein AB0C89_35595, partial [Streptomyces sp. NPDC048491]|uniref:hypothetical protein n=1 Tax=Streptomyces sp. NPDC048491 TaxID=3157207 RepID=UPI003415AE6F
MDEASGKDEPSTVAGGQGANAAVPGRNGPDAVHPRKEHREVEGGGSVVGQGAGDPARRAV